MRPHSGRHRGDGATPSREQLAEGQKLSREWFATHTCDSPPSPLNRLDVWLDLADAIGGRVSSKESLHGAKVMAVAAGTLAVNFHRKVDKLLTR